MFQGAGKKTIYVYIGLLCIDKFPNRAVVLKGYVVQVNMDMFGLNMLLYPHTVHVFVLDIFRVLQGVIQR